MKIGKWMMAGVLVSALLLPGATTQAQIREHNLKFALQPVKESAQSRGSQWFADRVKELSKGKIKITAYPGAVLGSDVAVFSAMQGGTIDFTLTSTGNLGGHDKALNMFDLPFLFNNEQEADFIADGPVGKKVAAKLIPKGLLVISYAELGFQQINNSKHPITKVEDFADLKLRSQTMPLVMDTIKALGSAAVPMNFGELYSALEQKVVDGGANPYDNIASQKFYEVTKYLSVTNHSYSIMAFLMSKKTWDGLNADEQKLISQAALEAGKEERRLNREANNKRYEELKKLMTVNVVSEQERARMREKIKSVYDKWVPEFGSELYNELQAELAKYRSGKK